MLGGGVLCDAGCRVLLGRPLSSCCETHDTTSESACTSVLPEFLTGCCMRWHRMDKRWDEAERVEAWR